MGTQTNIEWTDKTWSPWTGCTKVSPGCDHCYAENIADTRFKIAQWGAGKARKHTENWDSPRRWNKQAAKEGRTIRVFPSMCDPFDNEVPAEWRTRFFTLIRETPHLTWQLLSKRIGNANKMLRESGAITRNGIIETPLPNLWLGATCVNQEEWDRDISGLLHTLAAKRFVSIEPMLGAIDLQLYNILLWNHIDLIKGIPTARYHLDWVTAGGESGPGARTAHPDWFRSLRDQCKAARVPFFFKQWGEWAPIGPIYSEEDTQEHIEAICADDEHPKNRIIIDNGNQWVNRLDGQPPLSAYMMRRVGKKAAGNHLDGVQHLEFPQ